MFKSKTLALLTAPVFVIAATPTLAQNVEPDDQPINTEPMTQAVTAMADEGKFMGAVLVSVGDEPVLNRAWGSADLEWEIANTTDTKFRIGSVTKQFTAVSILLLQERGLIDLDAPIATYLKEPPPAWGPITVRNLMRHTAGLPNVTSLEVFAEKNLLPISQTDLIALFRDLPLEFEPGSQWSYSNSGYILLSRIVENVSGEKLGDFYQANIFDPLGMAETGFDVAATILPKRADGYSPAGPDDIINAPYADRGIPFGAGGLYSTTGDLLKWQRGLFGGEILSPASLTEYVTPTSHPAIGDFQYAHGVIIAKGERGVSYWHGGGIEGFNAWLGHDPDRGVTVAVLANLNGGAASQLGMKLMSLVQADQDSPAAAE